MNKYLNTSAIVVSAALAAAVYSPTANAKEVKIIVSATAPGIVTYVKMTTVKFIPEVNKRLAATGKDFKIKWIKAYAGAIAKAYE